MTNGDASTPVGELLPNDAWELLVQEPDSVLIDVRTRAEWGFVGVPDIAELGKSTVFVEWSQYPNMSINPRFAAEVIEQFGGKMPSHLLFICRSGARSLNAAYAVSDHLSQAGVTVPCINVAEGFEGDLDPAGHRGSLNGWKFRGLAWRQS